MGHPVRDDLFFRIAVGYGEIHDMGTNYGLIHNLYTAYSLFLHPTSLFEKVNLSTWLLVGRILMNIEPPI